MAALLAFACLLLAEHSFQADPFIFEWSDNTYGPDGPWHAVTVGLGSNEQQVDLYPGTNFGSTILASNYTGSDSCYSGSDSCHSGTYDPSESSEAYSVINGTWEDNFWWSFEGTRKSRTVLDEMTIYGSVKSTWERNITLIVTDDANTIYGTNTTYQPNVGLLSLGAPVPYRQYPADSENWGYWITSALYEDGSIPSESYGMHIGSVEPAIEPSLFIGGYDRNRVLGEVSTQPIHSGDGGYNGALIIKSHNISLGVEEGDSPFSLSNATNTDLTKAKDDNADSPEVNSVQPYIFLPNATCDAIVANLPVHYNASLGLYLWDTSNPDYEKIVQSSAYLSFFFEKDGYNVDYFEIKVPFRLLNLTLEAPLVDSPTPYSPLARKDSRPILGRAFMQAAFIGVNWNARGGYGAWVLAQAPGPDTPGQDIQPIKGEDMTIQKSPNSWVNTWSASWTPSGKSSSSSGLSSGAKIGIGVGVGVGVGGALVILGAVVFFLRRKRAARQDAAMRSQDMPAGGHGQGNELGTGVENIPPVEKPADTQPAQRHELPS